MSYEISGNQQKLHFKVAIIILSFMSLIFSIISSVEFFAYYETKYTYYDQYYVLKTITSFKEITGALFYFVIRILPVILFIVYILKFYKKSKATIILPVIFCYYALSALINIIVIVRNDIFNIGTLIMDLFVIFSFSLMIWCTLKGVSKKIIFIIPNAIMIALHILSIIVWITLADYWITEELYLYFLEHLGRSIALATFFTAILLFVIKNKIPAIIFKSSQKEIKETEIESFNPEQELLRLKEAFENSVITEEEYNAQRTEIINKL